MNLRPVDLPRLRDDLIAFARTDIAAEMREMDFAQKRLPPESVAASMKRAIWALQECDLFWVSAEMTELVEVAARTLPPFVLAPDDPPSRAGLLWFDRPLRDHDDEGHTFQFVAVGWQVVGPTVEVSAHVDRDELGQDPRINLHGLNRFPRVFPLGSWQEPVRETGEQVPVDENLMEGGRAILAATKTAWLLMRQPLALVESAEFDRAARRRAERDQRPLPSVRVIALRHPAGSGGGGGGSREWRHTWIVRGHWRMTACGVGREQRRPVWIAPHIKGPEGLPLLGGEKVYAWTR